MNIYHLDDIPDHLREYFQPVPQLGLEPTLTEYLDRMTEVFRECRRVLRSDGVCFANMGDGYAHNGSCGGSSPVGDRAYRVTDKQKQDAMKYRVPDGLKPKDLMGVPWRLAFRLQDDGWYLRSDIVWSKPNPMPESVRDRPTKGHEYVFMLTKSAKYWSDMDAVREPAKSPTTKMPDGWATHEGDHGSIHREGREKGAKVRGHKRPHHGMDGDWDQRTKPEQQANGANLRTVWTIATEPFPEAHFATFPRELAKRCILIGCPAGGLVLDPFAGSGTTGLVAQSVGRDYLLIELNPEYVKMARTRLDGRTIGIQL